MRDQGGFTLRRRANARQSRGFTLVELIISTAIAVVVGGLLISIFVSNTGLFYRESSKISEGLGINDSLSSIRSSIKQTQAVASGYPLVFPAYTSSTSELVLQIAAIDSSSNIIANTYDYIVYTTSQNKLYMKVFPDALSSRKSVDKILSSNVTSVVFNYLDSSGNSVTPVSAIKVKVTITLNQQVGLGTETNIATTEANLRND